MQRKLCIRRIRISLSFNVISPRKLLVGLKLLRTRLKLARRPINACSYSHKQPMSLVRTQPRTPMTENYCDNKLTTFHRRD